jgi:hypothetical protein
VRLDRSGWGPGGRRFKSCLPDHDLPAKRRKHVFGAVIRGAFRGANFAPHLHPAASQFGSPSRCGNLRPQGFEPGGRRSATIPSAPYAERAPGRFAGRVGCRRNSSVGRRSIPGGRPSFGTSVSLTEPRRPLLVEGERLTPELGDDRLRAKGRSAPRVRAMTAGAPELHG